MIKKKEKDDVTFAAMTLDILGNVLGRADSPADLGTYLTEEIRELTGTRCILFIQYSQNTTGKSHRVLSVNPSRRRNWAESEEARRLYGSVHQISQTQIWRPGDTSETALLLQKEDFSLSVAIPLRVKDSNFGAVLMLGMPDENHLYSVVNMLVTLSTVVALILSNASLFERQNEIIQDRTRELRLTIETLKEREKQVNSLLEKSEESRIALLSVLEDEKYAELNLRKLNDELENRIQERTIELEQKNADLERFNKVFVGRELRMIELKKIIQELEDRIAQINSSH